jgi:hypothetical protein
LWLLKAEDQRVGFREELQYSNFVLAIIGTALVVLLVASIITDRGYWETMQSLKSDVKSAVVIRKNILSPFKPSIKNTTVIRKGTWTPFKKVQANSIPALDTIWGIRLHFNLESDDTTIPLMIRTVASANGKLSTKVVGSSGIINHPINERQTFYVSVSHPSIKYRIKVLGYIEKPQSGVLKKLP